MAGSSAAGSSAAEGGGRQQGAATGSQTGCNGSGTGVQASAGGVDEQGAAVGSKRKRAQVYQSILSPAAKAARTGSPGGAAEESAARRRPAENAVEVRELVNVQYRWDWRGQDGAYVGFDKDQCIEIETCYRRGWGSAIVWGKQFPVGRDEKLKCVVIDFGDYTACIVGSDWGRLCADGAPKRPLSKAGTIRRMRCQLPMFRKDGVTTWSWNRRSLIGKGRMAGCPWFRVRRTNWSR